MTIMNAVPAKEHKERASLAKVNFEKTKGHYEFTLWVEIGTYWKVRERQTHTFEWHHGPVWQTCGSDERYPIGDAVSLVEALRLAERHVGIERT
jgi:hypothetical protein